MREEDESNIRGGETDMDIYRTRPDTIAIKYDKLYLAVNQLMATIGANGEVDSDHEDVSAVMDALFDIDGGAAQVSDKVTRKAYVCKHCNGIYADDPVSQCDCMEGTGQDFYVGVLEYQTPLGAKT